MRAEFGFCVLCEKEIAPVCAACGRRKPGNDYTEVELNLSDGSRTHQPLCLACAEKGVQDHQKAGLTEHWHKMFERTGKPHHDRTVRFV